MPHEKPSVCALRRRGRALRRGGRAPAVAPRVDVCLYLSLYRLIINNNILLEIIDCSTIVPPPGGFRHSGGGLDENRLKRCLKGVIRGEVLTSGLRSPDEADETAGSITRLRFV